VNYASDNGEAIKVISKDKQDSSDERTSNNIIKKKCINRVSDFFDAKLKKSSNSVYKTADETCGFYFAISKAYKQAHNDRYWFSYRKKEELENCKKCYYVFGCKDENTIVVMTQEELDRHCAEMNMSIDNETKEIGHWHVVFNIGDDKHVKWSLSRPEMHEIDITDHLLQ
jgi:hypothetical protein